MKLFSSARDVIKEVVVVLLAVLAVGLLAGFFIGRKAGYHAATIENFGVTETVVGPWGRVNYWQSVVEMPPALVARRAMSAERTAWFVGLTTMDDVGRALDECGLSSDLRNALLSTAVPWQDGGFVLRPQDEVVTSIPATARSQLYNMLARWPGNDSYGLATRFEKEGRLGWLDKTGLPSDVTDLVRKLIYRRGSVEMFADYDVVLRHIHDNRIARRFLRVMSRQNSVMGSLVVQPEDDLDALVRYWGRGGRENDVRTLLESARVSEGSHEVPLSMLLPPFVKERIYRYRYPTDPQTANCHYSSLNFFAHEPNEALTNLITCAATIDRDYVPVEGNYQLGDVVMFMRNANTVIHTCNIVFDHLVFSKNGSAIGQPWVIVSIDHLKSLYGVDEPIKLVVFRRRDMAAAPAPADDDN